MKTVSENTVKGNRNERIEPISINRGHIFPKRRSKPYSVRLLTKHQTKRKMASMLSKLGCDDEAERMNRCCEKFSAVTCGQHIVAKYPNYHCENRLCPFCAERLRKRRLAKYLPIVLAYAAVFASKHRTGLPCHLVLTLKHRKAETPKMMRKRLWDSFTKLRDTALFKSLFDGGLFTIESKESSDGVGTHTHLHGLVFRYRILSKAELQMLKDQWLLITGDSTNLRLDPVTDIRAGLVEVLKYINKPLKPEELTTAHVKQLCELKGLKMLGTFGGFFKFAKDFDPSDYEATEPLERFDFAEGDACPKCGEPLFETGVMPVNELIKFARRIEARTVPKPKPME